MTQNKLSFYEGNLRFVFLTSTYLIYLAFGGIVLCDLEWQEEMSANEKLDNLKIEFLRTHPTLTREGLETFLGEIKLSVQRGVNIKGNRTYNPNWNFGGALLYASSLLTTIGYGDISPSSNKGKLFSMVYAVIGIPMTATLLSALVSRWMIVIDFVTNIIKKNFSTIKLEPSAVQLLGTFSIITISSSIAFILPALIFAKIECWSYFDALYFCFITMTTVGLGDYVPGCSERWDDSTTRLIYKVLLTFYFIVGLSFMLLILELSGRVPETTPSLIFSCEARINRGSCGNEEEEMNRTTCKEEDSENGLESSEAEVNKTKRNQYDG